MVTESFQMAMFIMAVSHVVLVVLDDPGTLSIYIYICISIYIYLCIYTYIYVYIHIYMSHVVLVLG